MTKPLSPAAAAVMSAYYCDAPLTGRERVAAALRAAAKQSIFADTRVGATVEVVLVDTLLTIAAELEAS